MKRFCIFILLLAGCSQTDFTAPIVPSLNAREKPMGIRVIFNGNRVHDKEWLRSFAISRLFSTNVPNKSGSFAELMQGPIEIGLPNNGYRKDDLAQEELRILLQTLEIQWHPPQEFIQTLKPHRRGRYLIELKVDVKYPDSSTWTFERSIQGEAYPGDEIERINGVVSGLLAELLGGMLDHMPHPGKKAP